MKFIIDKALSPKLRNYLDLLGYKTKLVSEFAGQPPVEDEEIFEYAIEHNYIIITADVDFGQLLAFNKNERPSVIIFRVFDQRLENIKNKLSHVIESYRQELYSGVLLNIGDHEVRIYKLPLE